MKFVKVVLIIFFALTCQLVHAQNEIGFMVSVGSSSLRGDEPDLEDLVWAGSVGYSAGINYLIRLKEDMYLGISGRYLRTGAKFQTIDTLISLAPLNVGGAVVVTTELKDSININLDYLTVPVLLNVISDNRKFQFAAGIEAGFPIRQILDNGTTREELDYLTDVNLSIVFGLGYRIYVGKGYFFLNISYVQGIVNIVQTEDEVIPRVKSVDTRLSIGYNIPIHKNK